MQRFVLLLGPIRIWQKISGSRLLDWHHFIQQKEICCCNFFLNFITPQQIVYYFMINLHICKDELDATTTTGAHPTKFAHLQR